MAAVPAGNRQVAELIRRDPHAPHYHFLAPEGALARPFDPNGALFWKGRYHLFYIFQDPARPGREHCWGHASSADLLHWTYHPTALAAETTDPDQGIFSGNAFVNLDGVPTISYHGCGVGTCIATAQDDELLVWRKHPANPVIPEPRAGDLAGKVYNVFDPHMWVENGRYYVILGGRVKPADIRDTAYLFTSTDLEHWEYLRPFYNANPHWTGEEEDCACPDFFQLGNRHVLMCISHPRGARFYLGQYHNGTFIPEEHHRMNWPGGPCFAPESLLDNRNRRIFWTWAVDHRRSNDWVTNELGVMTLPRVLSLDPFGRPLIDPVEELAQLRQNPQHRQDLVLEDGVETPLAEIAGDVLELELDVRLPAGGAFSLAVRRSPDGAEQTVITVDPAAKCLAIDTSRSSLADNVRQGYPIICWQSGITQQDVRVQRAPFELAPDEPLRLRVFLDKSMLEVFANRRQCVTQRLYPSRPDSTGIALFSRGGPARVCTLTAWPLTSPLLGGVKNRFAG